MLFGRLDHRRRQHEGLPLFDVTIRRDYSTRLFDATQDVWLRIMREALQKVGVFP